MDVEITVEQAVQVGRVTAGRVFDLELTVAALQAEIARLWAENEELRKPKEAR